MRILSDLKARKFFIQYMIQRANIQNAKTIIEVGAGTGNVTEAIISKMPRGRKLIAIERNDKYVAILRKRCGDRKAQIVKDDANNISKYTKEGEADRIISTLPLYYFTDKKRKEFITNCKNVLAPNGKLLVLASVPANVLPTGQKIKKQLREEFKTVKQTKIVWLNTPPARIYICSNNKSI